MTRPDDAAFARPASELGFKGYAPLPGLTKREYFAAMALAGLSANPGTRFEDIGEQAVRRADETLAALTKGGDQ